LNSETTDTQPSRTHVSSTRSGAAAAFLSAIFPGLGQAYLGDRRAALRFATPVIALLLVAAMVVLGIVFSPNALARAITLAVDPFISLVLLVVLLVMGAWWIAAVVHAWRGGPHNGVASVVVVAVLVFAVGIGEVWGATSLWRIHNGQERIFTGNPLDGTPPPATPSPTPLAAGATIDPAATPTPRPPDYVDPREQETNEPEPTIEPGPTPEFDIRQIDPQSDGLLNVLLVGLDWQPGRTSKRTDTILVVSANSDTGELLMFSFPRDVARFPLFSGGTYNGKINTFAGYANRSPEVYPEGGMRALALEVGYLLGIPIDYYASVNMPGFMSVVELVGGVTVNNTRDIRDDTLQFYLAPGEHRLNAADALRYVRSRHGSGGDFGRNDRQQQVLAALRREFLKPQNLARLPEIVEAMSQLLSTDFPPSQIDQLLQLADEVEDEPSESWIFKYPQWADHLRRTETGGRSVIFLRMDRIAAMSIERFGEKSLWDGRPVPPPPTR